MIINVEEKNLRKSVESVEKTFPIKNNYFKWKQEY